MPDCPLRCASGCQAAIDIDHLTEAAVPRAACQVPGDILSDLQRAGLVGAPYFNTTWQEPSFVQAWNEGVWTYSTTFATPPAAAVGRGGMLLLVFDGLRMGAMSPAMLAGVVARLVPRRA